jgi:hypothetical protein
MYLVVQPMVCVSSSIVDAISQGVRLARIYRTRLACRGGGASADTILDTTSVMGQSGTACMIGNTDRANACDCQLQISEICMVSGMVLNR